MAQKIPIYKSTGTDVELVDHALVDDADLELVAGRRWYAGAGRYAWSQGQVMHRVILGVEKGLVVHHRNHVRLDNRRENLEVMEHGEHMRRHHRRQRLPRFRADGSVITEG